MRHQRNCIDRVVFYRVEEKVKKIFYKAGYNKPSTASWSSICSPHHFVTVVSGVMWMPDSAWAVWIMLEFLKLTTIILYSISGVILMYSYCYTMKIRFDQDQKSCPQTSARCRMALKFQDTKLSQNGFGKILSTGRRILENLEKGGTHYCRKLTSVRP